MEFSPEQCAIRDLTRDFARREIIPHAAAWDRDGAFPPAVLRRIGELGLFGVCVPPEHGGAGADFLAYILMTAELAYADSGLCNVVNATNAFTLRLLEFGNPYQQAAFLNPVARGEHLACMLLTEPGAGSDAAAITTRAVRDGTQYRVRGEKCFITSGNMAGAAVLIAVTDPGAGRRGISAFLIRPHSPGYRVLRTERKLGQRAAETCHIVLDDMVIDAKNMLGAPCDGLKVAFAGLESGRIGVAAQAVGVARAALDSAVAYARERRAFGRTLAENQVIAFQLADMATEIAAAWQLCLSAARLKAAGQRCAKEASMAKLFATLMCERVCSAALQIFGGHGYVEGSPVEKLYRDARVLQIYDGTNEVQRMLISRAVVGAP